MGYLTPFRSKMSLLKLSYHDDLLKQKGVMKMGSDSNNNVSTKRRTCSAMKSLSGSEIEEWARSRSAELAILRDWLKKQPHLPQAITDEHMLTFLHSCYYSVEQAKTKIDYFYTIRTHAPEIFRERQSFSRDMIQAQKMLRLSPLRAATPEGYNAIYVQCLNSDVSNFNFTSSIKAASAAMDAFVHYYPREENNVFIFDMQNVALAHLIKTNMSVLKKAMVYANSALTFRLKGVHVINASPLIQQIQTMLKPLIDDQFSKIIHIHMKDRMENFYKQIPKKYLPREYGGDGESLQEASDTLKQIIAAHESYLEEIDQMVVDERKRIGKAKTSSELFGLEGSFRKLELD